jgi:hypothetical protein
MKSQIIGFFLALIVLPSLHAQTATNVPADTNIVVANPIPAGQAPDEVMKKLSGLVHAGKYVEAQQLTAGLLLAYPDDQRLIKGKALFDEFLAAQSATNTVPAPQPTNMPAEQVTGMDKVEYNSLIELGREAQQTTDPDQQKKLLQQFMDESLTFLEKHPRNMLLWQLRGAAAIFLNNPLAGYEAGHNLLALGAADSDDPKLQQIIAKLKIKGWLDFSAAEAAAKQAPYDWLQGSWSVSCIISWHGRGFCDALNLTNQLDNVTFSIDGSSGEEIGGYTIADGKKGYELTGAMLDSGRIGWLYYYNPSGSFFNFHEIYYNKPSGKPHYPSGWVSIISYGISDDKRTMTMVIPSQDTAPNSENITNDTITLTFTKVSDAQN